MIPWISPDRDEYDRHQYRETVPRWILELAQAVMENAVTDLVSNAVASQADFNRAEARRWLFADDPALLFSFAWCCQLIDIDCNVARVAILRRVMMALNPNGTPGSLAAGSVASGGRTRKRQFRDRRVQRGASGAVHVPGGEAA